MSLDFQNAYDYTNGMMKTKMDTGEAYMMVNMEYTIKLEQQNAEMLKALKAILNSNAKPVYGIGGKKIKGFTLYLPKERYEKAWRAQAIAKAEGT